MASFITFLCTTKNGRTERLTVSKGKFAIGRSRECAIYMPFPEVSRTHCQIEILPDHSVAFTDIRASSVGILHNGRYKKAGLLNPGDELFIGDTRFVMVEFAGNVVVQDAPEAAKDQVRIDDNLAEGLGKAESAMQTALGISLVSGKTEKETGDVVSWADLTALSIAAKHKAPLPSDAVKPAAGQGLNPSLLIGMMAACLLVAAIAVAVAAWALLSRGGETRAPDAATPPASAAQPAGEPPAAAH